MYLLRSSTPRSSSVRAAIVVCGVSLALLTAVVPAPLASDALLVAGHALVTHLPFALAVLAGAAVFLFIPGLTARVRESESMYRIIVDATQDGIVIMAPDRTITFVNRRMAALLGAEPDEILGTDGLELVAREHRGAVGGREQLLRAGAGLPQGGEVHILRRDGTRLPVLSSVTPLRAPDGALSGLLVTVTDISPQVEARRKLERAQEILSARVAALEGVEAEAQAKSADVAQLASRLAAAHEELEAFSYSVSHDLRAPLRAIDGFSRELLASAGDVLDERNRHYLDRIVAATGRMSRLIDDLLDLARLANRTVRRETVDVTELAREVASELDAPHVHVADGLTASADPQLLRIVLHNLIGNAVKFSARAAEPRIEVFAAGGGLAVRDNGIGFDMQHAGRIFAPFQRLHPRSQFEGTGIGLALVQRIVHRHGGTIRVESAPGAGATFFFTLHGPEVPLA